MDELDKMASETVDNMVADVEEATEEVTKEAEATEEATEEVVESEKLAGADLIIHNLYNKYSGE